MAQLYAGTSGFAYPQWKPAFYPPGVSAKQFLAHYAGRLNCVEINYTFRHTPSLTTLENWVGVTPAGFLFCLKGHMRITHVLRLKEAGEATGRFLTAVDPLRTARRLGPILFQLPPALKCDLALLEAFLGVLPEDLRFAMEFRHASWLRDEVYKQLERARVCLCLAETEEFAVPPVLTADFVYFRLRKESGYSPEERQGVAGRCRELTGQGKDVFVFYKHEERPDGALYAEELLKANSIKS